MRLLYFAWVRERIGHDAETIDPPAEVVTAGDLLDWLRRRGDGHAAAFAEPERIRIAIDQQFADLASPISGAREIALFPPVTGG